MCGMHYPAAEDRASFGKFYDKPVVPIAIVNDLFYNSKISKYQKRNAPRNDCQYSVKAARTAF